MDSKEKKTLVDALVSYGLNEYEAKAYLALLQFGPAVAGEVSRRSGIPRPRVYDTLQRLIDASLVAENEGNPKSYSPLPLDDFLRNMAALFSRRQELLKVSLNSGRQDDVKAGVFHLFDEARIKERMQDLIGAARISISVSIPGQDLESIAASLDSAMSRGVNVSGKLYGQGGTRPEWEFAELSAALAMTEAGGRRFMLCRDCEEIMVGHIGGNSRSHAIATRSRLIIEELVRKTEDEASSEPARSQFVKR